MQPLAFACCQTLSLLTMVLSPSLIQIHCFGLSTLDHSQTDCWFAACYTYLQNTVVSEHLFLLCLDI